NFFAFDKFSAEFTVVDCPRCMSETGDEGAEVCPCLEDFSRKTIAMAIESLRAESAGHQEDTAEAQDDVENVDEEEEAFEDYEDDEEEIQDEWTKLRHALKWLPPSDERPVPVSTYSSIGLLEDLRAWAELHKEIRIPHPKAALLLHLIDHGMIEFGTL